MSEKLNNWLKKYQFVEGALLGILLCSWCYEKFRIDSVKESAAELRTKYDLKKDDYDKIAPFQGKFEEERVTHQDTKSKLGIASNELTEAKMELSRMVDNRWEQKFYAEQLARQRIESEKLILSNKFTSLSGQTNTVFIVTNDCDSYKDRLLAVEKERDGLRNLYSGASNTIANLNRIPGSGKNSQTATNTVVQDRASLTLLSTLEASSAFDAADVMLGGVSKVPGGIRANLFLRMLEKCSPSDRADVVIASAKHIRPPISPEEVKSIASLILRTDSSAAKAMSALQEAALK